jgi:hypothetical protein
MAGDRHPMASRRLPCLVALEIKAARRSTKDTLMRFANSFVK